MKKEKMLENITSAINHLEELMKALAEKMKKKSPALFGIKGDYFNLSITVIAQQKKEGRLRAGFSFKQQVMIDKGWGALSLIGVETPALLLPFLNCFPDILVVTNLHADIFFQLGFTFVALQNRLPHKNFYRMCRKKREG